MSVQRKGKSGGLAGFGFDEALARLLQTSPKELTESVASEVMRSHEDAKAKIKGAREEIADGARPRKGRFRL